ncbi:MFS transporter [Actinoplanes sp. N902-109]|uniref:MFS transporter n=1 Tax=Actinoplanes sp. (strain N902-109) TaxID=649831 RepID=UPI00032959C3|nr:MFS transporter [Actinoplanes sp. N902-109]AGL14777.1 major facilitator superfamily transporter [Actinoplanes sp. N902-109]
MSLTPYRETLALRGIKSLLVVATLARVPITAGTVTLTLHVTQDLDLGYGAAGLVGAAFTVGGSLGAPVMGRITDRRGLRPVLVLTTVAEVLFWTCAQALPYWALLVAALIGGFLTLPAFAVARQSIAALAPETHRLPAFALDSVTTELSFMAGPALGVLISTTAGPRVAMLAVGSGILLSGVGLFLLNPPTRAPGEAPVSAGQRVSRRSWLRPELIAVFAISSAATLVLSGTDVAVVAVLQHSGEVRWTGAVLALWAVYSLMGGFAYGTVRRGLPPLLLLAPMALLTVPVGLAGGQWWLLGALLLPAGALCAPTITATADAVSRLTPAAARGEAMGWHNSSLTVGVALGAPLSGTVMDASSPAWGFVAVGGVGLLVAVVVLPLELRRRKAAVAAEQAGVAAEQAGVGTEQAAGAAEQAAVGTEQAAVVADKAVADRGAGMVAGQAGAAGPTTDFPHQDVTASRP